MEWQFGKTLDSQLHEMKKGIGAVLWHCSNIQDLEDRHQFCPKSIHSWCKYQRINIQPVYPLQ